jgi:hypothetical protein
LAAAAACVHSDRLLRGYEIAVQLMLGANTELSIAGRKRTRSTFVALCVAH